MNAADIAGLRARLASAQGPEVWRSLEEVADTPEFRELLAREWPRAARAFGGDIDRRTSLKLMGGSLLMAGLAACDAQPEEEIVPYVRMPENVVPGEPAYYATALTLGGYATGILGEIHTGRPTRVEGNPDHPTSRGATSAFQQAAILELYDPDRSGSVRHGGAIASYEDFLAMIAAERERWRTRRGRGLRILTGNLTSPSLRAGIADLQSQFPELVWHVDEPLDSGAAAAGGELAFGRALEPRYRFAEARRVLSLDGAFLDVEEPGQLLYAREFAAAREVSATRPPARLYAAASTPSLTSVAADHRLPAAAGHIEGLARQLARHLGLEVAAPQLSERESTWIETVARDLQQHRGRAPVVAGLGQPPAVHALVHAINQRLGNHGTTVDFVAPVAPRGQPGLRALTEEIAAGEVDSLIMLGCNPVHTAFPEQGFAERLDQVRLTIHAGLYKDETAQLTKWHLPLAHELESWGDARAFDGTISLQQPLVRPLRGGRAPLEIFAALAGVYNRAPRELLRSSWQRRVGESGFESFWRESLQRGTVAESAAQTLQPRLNDGFAARLRGPPPAAEGLEVQFRPDAAVWDGRYANNAWLQELPRPLTKLSWGNAALIAPRLAEMNGLEDGDVVRITYEGRSVDAPVMVLPGQPPESITLPLGYGRKHGGEIAAGVGFDAYPLRGMDTPWFAAGAELAKLDRRERLIITQDHHAFYGRDLLRRADWKRYREKPDFAKGHAPAPEDSLYPEPSPRADGGGKSVHAWGMVIDPAACIGCNACIVACQAENNIPVVGPEQVALGREMHWLRIDRYYAGSLDEPATHFQPVTCMHCENAPCEYVCPVEATQHSSEGLNEMIYNRCIGTRYCSQNCPYKVRRFNWFDFTSADAEHPVEPAQQNPDVTVRARGVMEKCTYCVQRINRVRIKAGRENRRIGGDEVTTACQDACPTQAIVFGDIANPQSRVTRLKKDPRDYGLLAELNTRPRSSYLAGVGNPNPELDQEEES